jgi:hypothetical protein
MIVICISCMAKDIEQFFILFVAILTSSFEKRLFSSFAHFTINSLNLLEFSFFELPV